MRGEGERVQEEKEEEEEEEDSPGMEDSRPATAGCKGKLSRLAGGE